MGRRSMKAYEHEFVVQCKNVFRITYICPRRMKTDGFPDMLENCRFLGTAKVWDRLTDVRDAAPRIHCNTGWLHISHDRLSLETQPALALLRFVSGKWLVCWGCHFPASFAYSWDLVTFTVDTKAEVAFITPLSWWLGSYSLPSSFFSDLWFEAEYHAAQQTLQSW